MDRYSFDAGLLHPLLHAGLSRRFRASWLYPDEAAHAGREHFDEHHARRYDAKMDAGGDEEVALLQAAAVLRAESTVVDLGTGTGQFAMAAAQVCRRVVAVDISPVMLARLREKLDR